jgi:hypothetical protein
LEATVSRARAAGPQTLWALAEWRDKKVVWWGQYTTEAEALEAAGLRE